MICTQKEWDDLNEAVAIASEMIRTTEHEPIWRSKIAAARNTLTNAGILGKEPAPQPFPHGRYASKSEGGV